MGRALGTVETAARRIQVRGVVQGVGFRPFVYRLAHGHGLQGWVLNGPDGVAIHVEGPDESLDGFLQALRTDAPPAAQISAIEVSPDQVLACAGFEIRDSEPPRQPTTRISPDLPVCPECLAELADPADARFRYPYINCTNCGPRFSIVLELPYDRAKTTMAPWRLCDACAAEYHDPLNRRFHAQPVACPACGPAYRFELGGRPIAEGDRAIVAAADALRDGRIVAVKGIGGYHLVCDADRSDALAALRDRKFRKEKPFAVMVRNLAIAERMVHLTDTSRALLVSVARPIVLAPAREPLDGVAPDNRDVGIMLPYAPIHQLLFDSGAPDRLVMTSGNRSSEPIAYQDPDARHRLAGIADGFLVGDRPIARRVDDSIARDGAFGAVVLRRARGLAPGAVAVLPSESPILALGGDLKNSITLVVEGQAYVSQHLGDLEHHESLRGFDRAVRDLLAMYGLAPRDVVVAHDAHPQYASTGYAEGLDGGRIVAVQHHRAHVASVLAERGEYGRVVVGVALDGTGYGDDTTIWGGELFVGSVEAGFARVAHLRPAWLAGGDAAARHPVQAAAGYLDQLDGEADPMRAPFSFPDRYRQARMLVRSGVRSFQTTSTGRLFDSVAALLGFTRAITFEGQAAMWLEHLARGAMSHAELTVPRLAGHEMDWRPMLAAIVRARLDGADRAAIARAFHAAFAQGLVDAVGSLAEQYRLDTVVFSGGVMQNALLADDLSRLLRPRCLEVWVNRAVPPNDGGLSLGQAALAAFAPARP